MQNKYNQTSETSEVSEFKESFVRKFAELSENLTQQDRMQIAINLEISLLTVNRYVGGEIRRLELAESILSTAKEILRLKAASSIQ